MFAVKMGRTEAGLAAAHRSVVLDPLNPANHEYLGQSLVVGRRYEEAIAAQRNAEGLDPSYALDMIWGAYAYYGLGDFQSARAACERNREEATKQLCLAFAYDKLGKQAQAETMLTKFQLSSWGAGHPMLSAMAYAQWGDTARALDSLETAMRTRDPFLEYVKAAPWLDPLRHEPRFQTIERALKFPQ